MERNRRTRIRQRLKEEEGKQEQEEHERERAKGEGEAKVGRVAFSVMFVAESLLVLRRSRGGTDGGDKDRVRTKKNQTAK